MKKHSFASSVVAGEYTEVNEQEYVEQHTESLEPLGLRSCGLQAILAHIDLFFPIDTCMLELFLFARHVFFYTYALCLLFRYLSIIEPCMAASDTSHWLPYC